MHWLDAQRCASGKGWPHTRRMIRFLSVIAAPLYFAKHG
jgi:hypothetical protein